jgi:hypothetical protein
MVKRGIDGSDLGPGKDTGGKTHPESASDSDSDSIQTLMFIRHVEKPARGLGLLSCRGLNRALKLPD